MIQELVGQQVLLETRIIRELPECLVVSKYGKITLKATMTDSNLASRKTCIWSLLHNPALRAIPSALSH